jgi:hypothetical protein
MHDIVLVTIAYALQQLKHDDCRIVLSETTTLRNFLQECTPFDVLHDNIQILRIIEVLINTHDIGVVKRL